MFDGFKEEYERIKKGSTKPSRLAPLFPVIKAYEADPTMERLGDILTVMLDVMTIKKMGVKNVIKKYGRAFTILQREIEYERLTLLVLRQDSGTGDREAALKPRPSRSSPPSRPPSGRGVREELKEEIEEKGPASGSPARRPLTEEEKKAGNKIKEAWVRRRGRKAAGKLLKAGKARGAIRKLGYDVDAKGGFVPLEQKEAKGSAAHKRLEPEYVWEALDPEHHAGAWLAKVWEDWLKQKMTLSFWDFVKKNEGNPKYGNSYQVKYIKESELQDYKVTIARGQLTIGKGSAALAHRFDTRNMTVFFKGYHHGWGIYVQDLSNNIYSGPALETDKITIVEDPDSKQEQVTERGCQILHHSSFLAGQPTKCAGEWMVEEGRLISISMMTGHYKTKVLQFQEFLRYLESRGLNLKRVTVKWPWPAGKPVPGWVKYYRASAFADRATRVEYMQEPTRHGQPLQRLDVAWKPPDRKKPPRKNKPPTIQLGTPDYPRIGCSKCTLPPDYCECGVCTICHKSNEVCQCEICSQCERPDRECKCD
jgi:hypothetical protein